jgi:hypothetical protein
MGGPKTAIFTQVVHFYPDAVGHITIGGNKKDRLGRARGRFRPNFRRNALYLIPARCWQTGGKGGNRVARVTA